MIIPSQIDLNALRELISYVPKNLFCLLEPLKENILMPVDEISRGKYQIAVKTAQLEQELILSRIRIIRW